MEVAAEMQLQCYLYQCVQLVVAQFSDADNYNHVCR